jgi:hypothetical protein
MTQFVGWIASLGGWIAILGPAWSQLILIVIGGLWAAYVFYYKDILRPKSAPLNITMTLELQKIDKKNTANSSDNTNALSAVQINVSATNPSSRTVYLLPDLCIVRAQGITKSPDMNDEEFNYKSISDKLNQPDASPFRAERYVSADNWSLIAVRNLFSDEVIRPQEQIRSSIIFYLPAGKYDLVFVSSIIPTLGKNPQGKLALRWEITKDYETNVHLYRIDSQGQQTEIQTDKYKIFPPELEFQQASSSSALSLW